MNALYRLQVVQGNAIAQLAQLAQANHEMVNIRDEFIVDLNAQLDQAEGQIKTLAGAEPAWGTCSENGLSCHISI